MLLLSFVISIANCPETKLDGMRLLGVRSYSCFSSDRLSFFIVWYRSRWQYNRSSLSYIYFDNEDCQTSIFFCRQITFFYSLRVIDWVTHIDSYIENSSTGRGEELTICNPSVSEFFSASCKQSADLKCTRERTSFNINYKRSVDRYKNETSVVVHAVL